MMKECLLRPLLGYSFAKVETKKVRRRDDCSPPCWVHSCLAFVLLFIWSPLGAVSLWVGRTMECQGTWLQSRHNCKLSVKLDGALEGNSGGKGH